MKTHLVYLNLRKQPISVNISSWEQGHPPSIRIFPPEALDEILLLKNIESHLNHVPSCGKFSRKPKILFKVKCLIVCGCGCVEGVRKAFSRGFVIDGMGYRSEIIYYVASDSKRVGTWWHERF